MRISSRCISSAVNSFTLRTHSCGELRLSNAGESAKLYGWVAYKRLNNFIVLRDSYGAVQVRIPRDLTAKYKSLFKNLTYESVLRVEGTVIDRGEKFHNPEMPTGDVEIEAKTIEVLNAADKPLPVNLEESTPSTEPTRLAHRYIDLRSPTMQYALRLRSKVTIKIRNFLDEHGFIDVHTPTLAHSTPGGAAEFCVPASNPNAGLFYSLPQSPQLYKQLLMCGGLDKYYQIATCYRDEGSKPDRQPEFTQLDLELSFTTQDFIISLVESLISVSWPEELALVKPNIPFPRMTFADAMENYGTDKPDSRIPWRIKNCTDELVSANSGDPLCVKMFIAKGAADSYTVELIKELETSIENLPFKQNYKIVRGPNDEWFTKFNNDFSAKNEIRFDDIIVFCWGKYSDTENINLLLGNIRNSIGEAVGLRSAQKFEFLWIVDFPLFTHTKDGTIESSHHPFTAPIPEHREMLERSEQLSDIRAQHYDLVINGIEVGGGSIRIEDARLQRHVLEEILKLDTSSLSHFLRALSFGAPPHGGFALGLDRFIALLVSKGNVTSAHIRNVIAFPKNSSGKCRMTRSPSTIPANVLKRYALKIDEKIIEKTKPNAEE